MQRRRFINQAAKTFLGVSALPTLSGIGRAAGQHASPLKQIPTAKNVIYLYMNGGMSHLDTFDPKPNSNEVMGPTRAISTSADFQISEYLPRLAKQMNLCSVIRSVSSTQGAHKQGNYFVHTSYEMRSSIRHPAMGAWMMKFQDKGNPALPSNVMIGNNSQHPGAGFFESRFAPLMINNPEAGLQHSSLHPHVTRERFDKNLSISERMDQKFLERYNQKNVRAYTDMYTDAVKLMDSADLAAFDISKEPEALRLRYGSEPFGQGCLLARRLVESGVRFVEVSFGGWDTHQANFVNVPEKAEVLDIAMSTLLDDVKRRGMLDDTLIVLATEFGRTPEINQNEGRDHHPSAYSMVMAGGGMKQGHVHGATSGIGHQVAEGKVTPPDINATIGYALGLPLDSVLYSPSKRPFTLADRGKPIVDLFA